MICLPRTLLWHVPDFPDGQSAQSGSPCIRGGFRGGGGHRGLMTPPLFMLCTKIFEKSCDALIITRDVLIITRDVSAVHAHADQHTHNNNSIKFN